MQFHATVVGTGQTAAAQAAGLHAEVTAGFLHHNVGRDFGCTKEQVLGLVYGEGFLDTVRASWIIVIPAGRQFLEPDPVGRIAINLVGAHVDERRFGAGVPRGFQQIQGANSVGFKIVEWNGGGAVMAGLRGGVDDGIGPDFRDQCQPPARSRMSSS